MLNSKIILCQLMFSPKLRRKIIPLHIPQIQCLGHCLADGLIAEALGLPVNRLHALRHLGVSLLRIDLRLFHGQAVVLPDHFAIEDMVRAGLKGIPQKWHIIPGKLHRACLVL